MTDELTQGEADALMAMPKRLVETASINFPRAGEKLSLQMASFDERQRFVADVNRGSIRLTKCTYQERYNQAIPLVRLDLDGPPHENPDGELVVCPHLHIYREGAGMQWAVPLPGNTFADPPDLVRTLRDFLTFCAVEAVPEIQQEMF